MTKVHVVVLGCIVVLGGLAGVALWGSPSPEPAREPQRAGDAGAYCARHQIPEADCPWCDPSLIERKGMCGGHGVPEALCSRCDARLVAGFKVEGDWCAEHGLPESQCLVCDPTRASAPSAEPDTRASGEDESAEAGVWTPRTQKPPSAGCATSSSLITLASADVAADAGFEFVRVEQRHVAHVLEFPARVAFDADRHAHLGSRAPGFVTDVKADLGERVETGQILAVVDCAALGTAKADYLRAGAQLALWTRTHDREERLAAKNISSESEYLEAQTRLSETRIGLSQAEQALSNLGITEGDIARIARTADTSPRLPIRSPFPGIVVERAAALGEAVDESTRLFAVADTTTMWVFIDVPEAHGHVVRHGHRVELRVAGLDLDGVTGGVDWVSPRVDRQTRTVAARAEVANPDGMLRDGMFATAVVTLRPPEERVIVPKTAVQWEGCCNVVFVRRTDAVFEPRKVRLGFEWEGAYVVEDGLRGGETVVTTGSFLLKTELVKGSIGAGCCEVLPGSE